MLLLAYRRLCSNVKFNYVKPESPESWMKIVCLVPALTTPPLSAQWFKIMVLDNQISALIHYIYTT